MGIRYCGGCNPRYDRVAAVERLMAALPQVRFFPARPGEVYDVLLVVCGCPAQCASTAGLAAPKEARLYLISADHLPDLEAALRPPAE